MSETIQQRLANLTPFNEEDREVLDAAEAKIDELSAKLLATEKDATLMRELERAAEHLPEWTDVIIRVERGAAIVSWSDSSGNEYDIDGDGTLATQLKDAIDAAIAESKEE